MRVVAINNLDEKSKKLATKRLNQKDNVLLLDLTTTIELSKAGVLGNYLNRMQADEKILTYILNSEQEEELLRVLLDSKLDIIDGNKLGASTFEFLINIDNYFNKKTKFKGKVKLPPEYNNIPKDYQDTVGKIYEDFKKLDNRVLFLLVTGSVNRGCVYDKWSDIDLIIALEDKNDQKARDQISDIVNKQKIKVGTTVYSRTEFESAVVDYKTMAAICDVNRGFYRPLIIDEDLNLPVISREELIIRAYELVPNMLHSMRRYTYKGCKVDYVKLFKDLSHFMRCLDWMEDIFPNSYEEVAKAFNEIYGEVLYSPNGFLKSVTTNENVEREKSILLAKTKEFLDFCDNRLLKVEGYKNDQKVRKLQNQ